MLRIRIGALDQQVNLPRLVSDPGLNRPHGILPPSRMGRLTGEFFFNAFSIILIDILLSGDNAVVIALAVRSLPPRQRRLGIAFGAGGAATLRIVLTFFASRLLTLNYVQFVGGLVILWIAVKLLTDAAEASGEHPKAGSLWQAMWLILVADVTMSVDNILAVAATSKGNLPLLIFGLVLSILFVVFTSNVLSRIIDRYPVLVYAGAAILGRVGGSMMVSDPWIKDWLQPSHTLDIGVQVFFAVAVLIVGRLLIKRRA
jgi:YjbE family integral membrane protein